MCVCVCVAMADDTIHTGVSLGHRLRRQCTTASQWLHAIRQNARRTVMCRMSHAAPAMYYGRSGGVWRSHELDSAHEQQQCRRVLRHAMVRPCCELELANFTSLTRRLLYTIQYNTRCHFDVRSKADMSQLSLPHGTDN